MNEEEKKLMDQENKIPGTEKVSDAETGTAENSVDEAAMETQESNDVEDIEGQENDQTQDQEIQDQEIESEPEENPVEENPVEENPVEENPVEEKMLTQSQVNELVGKARAEGRQSAMKELYGRYGVNDDAEMNDIFGRGQGYELLNDEYNTLNGNYKNLAAENALLKSQVVPGRWDDVKAILGSKGMEVTAENIQAEMVTHPEWMNGGTVSGGVEINKELTPEMAEQMADGVGVNAPKPTQPVSTIRKLGTSVPEPKINSEDEEALRLFGLNR